MSKFLKALNISAPAALLVGCATPLPQMSDDFLCRHYGSNQNGGIFKREPTEKAPSILEEIRARRLLSPEEAVAVQEGRFAVGMSKCAMYSALGHAHTENTTTNAAGIFVQHIFSVPWRGSKRIYVYTQNGRISSWQQ